MVGRQGLKWAALLGVVTVIGAACSSKTTATTPTGAPSASAGGPITLTGDAVYNQNLKGICPDKIVLQTDWFPEPEHGGAYNLIGTGGTTDPKKGTYTGEIKSTGVQLEIRAGGPFVGFQPPVAQMYSDPNVQLGYADTGDIIRNSAKLPVVSIVSPLDKSPQMLMYNPAKYDFKTVSDVKTSGAKVLYFGGAAFMDYLIGTGQLDAKQADESYDGSPARFVGSGGAVVQQGFATDEPHKYENGLNWNKPVSYLVLYDAGWTIYQSAISVKPADLTKYHDCWRLLVPMFQQSEVDYLRNPTPINDFLNQYVKDMATFWTLTPEGDQYAVSTLVSGGFVGNGSDNILGNFDMDRLKKFMDEFVPIEQQKKADVKDGITPQDVVTNEFIDPNIHL
jgi:hypothetical protein